MSVICILPYKWINHNIHDGHLLKNVTTCCLTGASSSGTSGTELCVILHTATARLTFAPPAADPVRGRTEGLWR